MKVKKHFLLKTFQYKSSTVNIFCSIYIFIPYIKYVCIYIYIYIYIYTKIKNLKTRCARVNIKEKDTFSTVTNISVVLHNLLQCV